MKYKISSIVLTVVLAVFFIGVCLMIAITVGNTTEDSEKQEMSPELIFSEPAGFYGDSISLELSDKASQSDIYYTTDCSEPNADNGIYYESPIMLECKDTENVYTIRAALFNGDQRVTPVSTSTYILSRDVESRYTTLVISLVAPKTTLTDRITGIFSSRNLMIHGRKMERAASVEFFEPNGKLDVSQNIGVRVFGNYTRGLPLKSLKLAARKEYDDKGKFHFEPFVNLRGRTGNPIIEFDKLILRNSGNDFNMSMIRDAFGQQLGKSAGLDCQEYRPAVIYINGVYNGIINIREDENKDEIYSHYGIPSENVAVVSIDYNTKKYELSDGPPSELDNYENMLNFIKDRNMKVQENYEKAEEMLDIDSFIKYFAFEIYVANRDWPQNNLKAWRFVPTDSVPVDPDIYGMDGKWRFMLKDLDFGFSYYSETTEKANLFNVIGSVDEFGVGVMAGNLMKNPEFKNKFITYMSDILYDTGNPAKANDLLSRMQFSIAQEMQYNVKKWGSSIGLWNNQILSIKNFINRRPDNIIVQMEKYFKLSEPAIVNLVTTEGGSVQFSSVKIDLYNNYYNGKYFKNIPIPIKAVPDEGYIFQGFEVIGSSIENDSIMLEGDTDIKAVFIRDEDYFKSKGSLVINEVMYSSNNASGHDWIELYNSSEKEIILNDYFLSDTLDHPYKWQFPKYILYPGQFFLVNCTGQDIVSIPDNYQTKFKLKEGETVILSYFDDIIDTFYIDKSVDNCQTEEAYSMGRYPDGSGNYLLLSVPTPEEANVVFDYNMYVHPSINDKVMVNGVIKSGLSVAVIDGNLYIDDNSENLIPVEDYATSLNRDYFYVSSINAIAFFKKS